MDQPGDEPFAGTRLSLDENWGEVPRTRPAPKKPTDLAPHGLDRGTLTDHLFQEIHGSGHATPSLSLAAPISTTTTISRHLR